MQIAEADAVLLATGGAGQVFSDTTNPPVATGDGVAMAYRAGARVVDLEFVQFHPTALRAGGQPRFLLSEALRGEGARLINAAGEPFMARYDPSGDLAPRDRVARAIEREAQRTAQPVYLSLQHLDRAFVHARFPLLSEVCRRAGLDLARDRIPVGPAAHYVMGGVQTDLDGRTSIPGLFAAGEVACTGVHGANRLASNSLLEGLVFGARAGAAMRSAASGSTGSVTGADRRGSGGAPAASDVIETSLVSGPTLSGFSRTSMTSGFGRSYVDTGLSGTLPLVADVQTVMWKDVGLFRHRDGLQTALAMLEPVSRSVDAQLRDGACTDPDVWRSASLLTVATLVARAALRREESRGAHYRADYPSRDDIHWKRRIAEAPDDVR
jgi:L-aspartate oxidase